VRRLCGARKASSVLAPPRRASHDCDAAARERTSTPSYASSSSAEAPPAFGSFGGGGGAAAAEAAPVGSPAAVAAPAAAAVAPPPPPPPPPLPLPLLLPTAAFAPPLSSSTSIPAAGALCSHARWETERQMRRKGQQWTMDGERGGWGWGCEHDKDKSWLVRRHPTDALRLYQYIHTHRGCERTRMHAAAHTARSSFASLTGPSPIARRRTALAGAAAAAAALG
jgi:hypothetical protein